MAIPIVKIRHVSKRFANVLANDDISIDIYKGEVLSLLGENGAGKSTIMKILYGLYHATSGEILIDGEKVNIENPKEAIARGISMIQQHFSLVPAHTVTENIILGNVKGRIDYKVKEQEIQSLADKYHFSISAKARVCDLTVGEQQKVEILKALYLNARILIMDEPTAVLTPQEIRTLMEFIKEYVSLGNTVVFISHKMKEVMEVSDTIIVMRNGEVCSCVKKDETNEMMLAKLMIGHDLELVEEPGKIDYSNRKKRLQIEHLTLNSKDKKTILDDISFDIYEGEVLGIAGVSGNGQQELCNAIYGCISGVKGSIKLDDISLDNMTTQNRIDLGIGYSVSDRYRYGIVPEMSLSENMLLKSSKSAKWIRRGLINWKGLHEHTDNIIKDYSIKAVNHSVAIGNLSGGNQQKAVVAREVEKGRALIIFDQPTRGLDLGAVNHVHKIITREKHSKKAVLLVSTELSEIFALSDRIAILYQGKIMGIYKNGELTSEQIGLLMAGIEIDKKNKGEAV